MSAKKQTSRLGLMALLFTTLTGVSHASGQRSALVTLESIEGYRQINLQGEPLPHPSLRYVGTVNTKHLLMITLSRYSARSDGRPGMPSNKVFAYSVSTELLNIINGWDISGQVAGDGIVIRPDDCPRLPLTPTSRELTLPDKPAIKRRCIKEPRKR